MHRWNFSRKFTVEFTVIGIQSVLTKKCCVIPGIIGYTRVFLLSLQRGSRNLFVRGQGISSPDYCEIHSKNYKIINPVW